MERGPFERLQFEREETLWTFHGLRAAETGELFDDPTHAWAHSLREALLEAERGPTVLEGPYFVRDAFLVEDDAGNLRVRVELTRDPKDL